MTKADIEAQYRRYLSYLFNFRFDELGEFVHEELIYNGEPMTLIGYQKLMAEVTGAVSNLSYDIELLVIDGDQLACRLSYECTPQREFFGLQPNGKSISFSEHAFYGLRDGKIYRAWTLLDRLAIEEQLAY